MDRPTALLDANVLYPAGLRDVLLRLADRGLYRPKWSAIIHDEWMKNVIKDRPDLNERQIAQIRDTMDQYFPDALVKNHDDLIPDLNLPDEDDRHVLAAAIRAQADVLITQNLKDFPADQLEPHGIEAQHPDEFVVSLFNVHPQSVVASVREHRAALKKPPRSADNHLAALNAMGLVSFATALDPYVHSI